MKKLFVLLTALFTLAQVNAQERTLSASQRTTQT